MTTPYYNANHASINGTQCQRPIVAQVIIVPGTEVEKTQTELLVPSTPSYSPPADAGLIVPPIANNNPDYCQREPQPTRCRDVFWALLFYGHLAAMVWVAGNYVPQMVQTLAKDYAGDGNNNHYGGRRRLLLRLRFLEDYNNNNDNGMYNVNGWNYNPIQDNNAVSMDVGKSLSLVAVTGVTGIVFSTLALGCLIHHADSLISFSILATIVVTLLSGIASMVVGQVVGALMALTLAALLIYYAWNVWNRIPFAATNLVTATVVVRDNLGLAFYAYVSLCLTLGWAVWWSAATISCLFVLGDCEGDGTCNNNVDGIVFFGFLLSYYWTVQVISNVVGVTVAGVTGTWWMAPLEASSCCSKAVTHSYFRAMTYSFGSICLGSLIVAIITAVKDLVRQLRDNNDSVLVCCAECVLSFIQRLADYFNEWAFTFVGLYGFSFMEAGLEVMTLFRSRGWTNIITDDLAGRALLILSIFVALLNGILSFALASIIGIGDGIPGLVPFTIGLVMGITLCSTLFSVVGSAVKSVIVLYAEAPQEFQLNHPGLSARMRAGWRQAWPLEFTY